MMLSTAPKMQAVIVWDIEGCGKLVLRRRNEMRHCGKVFMRQVGRAHRIYGSPK